MNGEVYTGYKRNGKVVEHNFKRPARVIKKLVHLKYVKNYQIDIVKSLRKVED